MNSPERTPERRSMADHWGIEASSTQALSVGVALGGVSTPDEWERVLAWCEHAEAMGMHSVWLPEMHFAEGGATSPLLNLAAIAARTSRLRLATTSLLLPIRAPLQVAEEVACLDRLSNGRVILGLGRGFRAALFSAFGVDPASKRDRFDDALDRILAAWRDAEPGPPTDTPDASKDGAAGMTRPLQRPHPPLAVAAFGRKGLAQAARRGLPYLASPLEPIDLIEENLEHHRELLPEDVSHRDLVVPIMRTVFVSESPEARARVLERLAGETAGGRRGAKLPASIARSLEAPIGDRVLVGGVAEVRDRLARYRERLGLNLLIVRPQIAGAPSVTPREGSTPPSANFSRLQAPLPSSSWSPRTKIRNAMDGRLWDSRMAKWMLWNAQPSATHSLRAASMSTSLTDASSTTL